MRAFLIGKFYAKKIFLGLKKGMSCAYAVVRCKIGISNLTARCPHLSY